MILITGGLGYLGAHTAASLVAEGHEVLLVDNMMGTRMEMLERLEFVTSKYITFVRQDIRNTPAMQRIFEQYGVSAVVHFAGLNANADSVVQPLEFYNANVGGLLSILRVMGRTGVRTLLYGSSATVYAASDSPVTEDDALDPLTPYARGHDMCEQFLHDIDDMQDGWRIAMMRYFHVAGSHSSHVLGELPVGLVSKLFPTAAMVAQGIHDNLPVYGDDHGTSDGTCIRDYVHVQDAVEANMQALAYLHSQESTMDIFNIGSGKGSSILQVAEAFTEVSGEPVDTEIIEKRPFDVPHLVANIDHVKQTLKWEPKHDLAKICEDTWEFFEKLSNG